MDINRNQFFLAGLVILVLGVQFRSVDAFVLNEKTSQFVAKQLKKAPAEKQTASRPTLLSVSAPTPEPREVIRPPKWSGWALMSIGGVLILHSLAMPRPD